MSCDWLEPGFLWCLFFFFCRMQFKHTLGLQDFMNRTENQEQSRAKKRGRGKRGNEIVAREKNRRWRREKRGERRDDDLRGKTKAEKGEKGAPREGARPVNECQTGFMKMHCLNAVRMRVCQYKFPITHSPLLGSS